MKILVIGAAGNVGEAITTVSIAQNACTDMVLQDIDLDKLDGLVEDVRDGETFHGIRVHAFKDVEDYDTVDLVVISAGARQGSGESRLELLSRNRAIMTSILTPLVPRLKPTALVLVVSNPCDVLTQIVLEISKLSPQRVFGSGTLLDTGRFRRHLAQQLPGGPSARHVHAFVLGEHGDTSVACATYAVCGANRLIIDDATLKEAHARAIGGAQTIIEKRGYTNIGIGFAVAYIAKAIANDTRIVIPLSVNTKEMLGVDACVSLPCVIGRAGVLHVLPVCDNEREQVTASARFMAETFKT